MKVVLITGASGLVGKTLSKLLAESGYTVRKLTTQRALTEREGFFYWNPSTMELDEKALEGVDYIIHLAGSSIGAGRWTNKRKQEIEESRTGSATLLFNKVKELKIDLKAFISSSATGYYGSTTSETIFDEYSPAGNDFLAKVCVAWEKSADRFQLEGIRTVKLRTGVVLAKGAPALEKMLLPIKLGIGGPLGNGRQHMPWIYLGDLCRMYLRAIEDETMSGAWNAVAPQHITNRQLMKALAHKLHKPFFFPPVPAFILKMLLGEMAIIITDGSRVTPRRFNASGFTYEIETIYDLQL
ncbi:MAG: TIGR01777 family oxidoreductase [Paludibacter sp.]|jgi:uncharacterized protein (TIGR01777 family)|nr:TIGR01777 family oxidoreductase [Paludibacter sp.]